MSMTLDGVWKAGVWASTVWANGVWFEGGAPIQHLGGIARWNRRIRGREIPEEVAEIIEEIAAPVVLADSKEAKPRNIASQEVELRAELKAKNIAWRKIYREALAELIAQQNEDDAICMLLCEI